MNRSSNVTIKAVTAAPNAADRERSLVSIEAENEHGEPLQWQMPALDAMYLLNALLETEQELGLQQRNRPARAVLEGRPTQIGHTPLDHNSPDAVGIEIRCQVKNEPQPWLLRWTLMDCQWLAREIQKIAGKLKPH